MRTVLSLIVAIHFVGTIWGIIIAHHVHREVLGAKQLELPWRYKIWFWVTIVCLCLIWEYVVWDRMRRDH